MVTPIQVLVGLGIFFSILWAPLVLVFVMGRKRSHRVPPEA